MQFDEQERFQNQHEAVAAENVAEAKELGVELLGLTALLAKCECEVKWRGRGDADEYGCVL